MRNLSLGLDIGTTTISASVVDIEAKKQIQAYTVANQSFIDADEPFRKEQDAILIFTKIDKLLSEILLTYPEISKIGVTGQMHGIVYVDEKGNAVSPLYTWQDGHTGLIFKNNQSYAETIQSLTGKAIGVGYGVATHYYNVQNGFVPKTANKFCTVMDYVTMRLCGENEPKIHPTNAGSLGLFDVEKNDFDYSAIEKLGLDKSLFPCVVETNYKVGEYNNIPVYIGIGDNQASFFGAVANEENSVLVNYGTGSQVSFVKAQKEEINGFEIRPYRDGLYLYSGAAICGGRAYAIVEKFFSEYLSACGISNGKQYETMNALAQKAYKNDSDLVMETTFCGTRSNPKKTGGVYNLREDNFTPENFVYATLKGMAWELFDMFSGTDKTPYKNLIASGNAVRLNPVFQSILARIFDMELYMPTISEEAAFGTALWINADVNKEQIKECISYKKGERV